MIADDKFLVYVQKNASRVTHYESGGDGSGDGGCDCIGLIIGALRMAGEKWNGTHGSNYAARYELQEKFPVKISNEDELIPGMAIFKARYPGDSGYNLPDSYPKGEPDFYHVGVVLEVKPLKIVHCTKSSTVDGITYDTKLGKWEYYGKLKDVSYSGTIEPVEVLYQARVFSKNGQPVRLRPEPNTDKPELCKVPTNEVVDILDDSISGWDKIDYNGIIGYMMSEFLIPITPIQDDDMIVSRSALEDIFKRIMDAEKLLAELLEG